MNAESLRKIIDMVGNEPNVGFIQGKIETSVISGEAYEDKLHPREFIKITRPFDSYTDLIGVWTKVDEIKCNDSSDLILFKDTNALMSDQLVKTYKQVRNFLLKKLNIPFVHEVIISGKKDDIEMDFLISAIHGPDKTGCFHHMKLRNPNYIVKPIDIRKGIKNENPSQANL